MKTWQMIKELTENPKLRFKNDLEDVVKICDKTKRIVWEPVDEDGEETPFIIYSHSDNGVDNLHAEWEIIRDPVDFMMALNNGRNIKPAEGDFEYNSPHTWLKIFSNSSYLLGKPWLDYVNGKWHVE